MKETNPFGNSEYKSGKVVRFFLVLFAVVFLSNNLVLNYAFEAETVLVELNEKGETEGENETEDTKEEMEKDDYFHLLSLNNSFENARMLANSARFSAWENSHLEINTPPPERS